MVYLWHRFYHRTKESPLSLVSVIKIKSILFLGFFLTATLVGTPLWACTEHLTPPQLTPDEYYAKMKTWIDNLYWETVDLRYDFTGSAKFNLFLRAKPEVEDNTSFVEFQSHRLLISQVIEEFFKLNALSGENRPGGRKASVKPLSIKAKKVVDCGVGLLAHSFFNELEFKDPQFRIWDKLDKMAISPAELAQKLKTHQEFLNANKGVQEGGLQVEFDLTWPKAKVFIDGQIWSVVKKEPRLLAYLFEVVPQKASPRGRYLKDRTATYDRILQHILADQTIAAISNFEDLARVRYEQSVSLLALLHVMHLDHQGNFNENKIKTLYTKFKDRLEGQDKIVFYFVAPTWQGAERGVLQLQALEIIPPSKLPNVPNIALRKLYTAHHTAYLPATFAWPLRSLSAEQLPAIKSFRLPTHSSFTLPKDFIRRLNIQFPATTTSYPGRAFVEKIRRIYQMIWNSGWEDNRHFAKAKITQAKEDILTIDRLFQYMQINARNSRVAERHLQLANFEGRQMFFMDLQDEINLKKSEAEVSPKTQDAPPKIAYLYLLDPGAWPFHDLVKASASPVASAAKK